jgi:hypothetical protein
MRQTIARFFKPGMAVILFTTVFTAVMIVGLADRYAFTCGGSGHKCEGIGIERPLLYGIPCYCWVIWVMTSAPILWLQFYGLPQLTENDDAFMIESSLFGGYSALALAINIGYYYVGSCALVYSCRKMKSSPKSFSQST